MNKPHKTTRRERQLKRALSMKMVHEAIPLLKKEEIHVRNMKRNPKYRYAFAEHLREKALKDEGKVIEV